MKKGAAHVEFILAFIIFVSVFSFAVYFFNPVEGSSFDRLIEYSFDKLRANVSSEIEEYAVIITDPALIEDDTLVVEIDENDDYKVAADNYTGYLMDSWRTGDRTYVKGVDVSKVVTLRYGNVFDESESDVEPDINEDNYDVASYVRRIMLSEKLILELNKSYYEDYDNVKAYFGLPDDGEFSFTFSYSPTENVSAQKKTPRNEEVYVKEGRFQVIRLDGRTEFADLRVRIW